jgi:hypothetical protein
MERWEAEEVEFVRSHDLSAVAKRDELTKIQSSESAWFGGLKLNQLVTPDGHKAEPGPDHPVPRRSPVR